MPRISRNTAGLYIRSFAQGTELDMITTRSQHDGDSEPNHNNGRKSTSKVKRPDPAETGTQQRVAVPVRRTAAPEVSPRKGPESDPRTRLVQNQCLKIALQLFNRSQQRTRSIGFTSAIPGEGKTLLASVTASALADRSRRNVTLVDCNWDNPSLHSRFGVPKSPGLAEWLRQVPGQECTLADVRYAVTPWLTVIPSGDAHSEMLGLADRFRSVGADALLATPQDSLIVDLPSVLTTDYGTIISEALDAVLLVVRAGMTQEAYIVQACRELAAASIEGTVLNASHSSIPRWLLRLL